MASLGVPNPAPVPAGAAEPSPVLFWETINAYQRTAALRGAIDLELFTAVGGGFQTVEALAGRCHASERGLRVLCDYLTVIGFLTKENGRYGLTPRQRRLPPQTISGIPGRDRSIYQLA